MLSRNFQVHYENKQAEKRTFDETDTQVDMKQKRHVAVILRKWCWAFGIHWRQTSCLKS
jgi:hypothetical protein